MLKLAVLLAMLCGVAAAVTFVPLHGRTVLDRWRASPGPVEFVERGWAEARSALATRDGAARAPASRTPRTAQRPAARSVPAGPRETHTDHDRAALDRIVAEHAAR